MRDETIKASGAKEGVFRRILVAVDEGEQACAAVDLAGRLAQQLGADIILLHVYHRATGFAPGYAFVETESKDNILCGAEAIVRCAKAKIPASVTVETALREGDPSRDIVEAAQVLGADLIIMGTNSRGRIGRAFLSSVATTVVRHAHCPVLTVGDATICSAAAPAR